MRPTVHGARAPAAAPGSRPPARPARERSRSPDATAPASALAELLARELGPGAVIAGITSDLSAARAVAARLSLPVLPAPVIPLAPPWNDEPAYGAVAFDGSVHLDDDLLRDLELGRRDLERAVARARDALAAEPHFRDPLALSRRHAAVVDDGRAPAVALAAAALALRNAGAGRVIAAVFSGSCRYLRRLSDAADLTLCAGAARPH